MVVIIRMKSFFPFCLIRMSNDNVTEGGAPGS